MSDTDKPLTMEELADAKRYIEDRKASNNNGTYCLTYDGALRLIAAAERSCRRPIADAPKDGTLIDVITIDGDRVPDVGFWRDHWRIPGGDEVDPLMTSGHGIGWFPIPGEGGV